MMIMPMMMIFSDDDYADYDNDDDSPAERRGS